MHVDGDSVVMDSDELDLIMSYWGDHPEEFECSLRGAGVAKFMGEEIPHD